jgi:superfamily II DNA/RNA helicase
VSSQSSTDSALPETTTTFEAIGVPEKVIAALRVAGIEAPTPVQAAVIPDALAGHDVLGRAQTGSGKTLAFGIPVIARLAGSTSRFSRPRAIIVVPTRELASQVSRSLDPFARSMKLKMTTVYGGTSYDRQIKALRQGADIVVATPGRLADLIDKGACGTEDVQIIVLDEADHLCDLGFYPEVDKLLKRTPADGQRLLLSATLDGDVDRLVRAHLRDPKRHELDPNAGAVVTMDHHVMIVGGFADKVGAVRDLVEANDRTIVFTRTREGAMELRDALGRAGIEAVDLHGNLNQRVRERNLQKFSSGRAKAVVATDVAARGIHVDGVSLVIHFDAPNDPKAYLHRSGRTARAGESGAVVTLTTRNRLDEVHRLQRQAQVTALLHDSRTAPQPMTIEALAKSEMTEAVVAPARGSSTSSGSGGPRGRGGYKGGGYKGSSSSSRPQRSEWKPREDRPDRGDRPSYRSDTRPAGKSTGAGPRRDGAPAARRSGGPAAGGNKQSWSKPDRQR